MITVPWNLFLISNRKIHFKNTRDYVIEYFNKNFVDPNVAILESKLESYKYNQTMATRKKIDSLVQTLMQSRNLNKTALIGIELNSSPPYPGKRKVVFVKPGKESFDHKNYKRILNKHDTLPVIIKGSKSKVVKLATQINEEATMGELARELAKVKRYNQDDFNQICAVLIRMAYFYIEDHEKLASGGIAWNPASIRSDIDLLHKKLKNANVVDLWDLLLVCHAISMQECVKYSDSFQKQNIGSLSPQIGRHSHLTSMIVWADILGARNDSDLLKHASKLDVVMVYNAVIKFTSHQEIIDFLSMDKKDCPADVWIRLELESKTKPVLESECEALNLPKSGNIQQLVNRIFPFRFLATLSKPEVVKMHKDAGLPVPVQQNKIDYIQQLASVYEYIILEPNEVEEQLKVLSLSIGNSPSSNNKKLCKYRFYEAKSVKELKVYCRKFTKKVSGTKNELVARLLE